MTYYTAMQMQLEKKDRYMFKKDYISSSGKSPFDKQKIKMKKEEQDY